MQGVDMRSQIIQNSVPLCPVRVEEAMNNTIDLTTDEQLTFWNALNEAPRLTKSQKKLGAIMRGKE